MPSSKHYLATYSLYSEFLREYQPYYNVFYLTQLFDMAKDHEFYNIEMIKDKWQEHLRARKNKFNNLEFHIDIPFCQSKCEYCMYDTKIAKSNREIERYIDNLIAQMRFFKEIFHSFEFNSLYVWGGTPSLLTEQQINKLFSKLFQFFNFKKNCEKNFQCNPQSISLRKLKLLKKFEFNRISLGVQSLDSKVSSFANRDYQTYELIKKIIKEAKSCGLATHMEIMAGLKGEDIGTIIDSFTELAKLKTDSIALCPLKPSDKYLDKYFKGDYFSFDQDFQKKMNKVRKLLGKTGKDFNYFYNFDMEFEIYTSIEPIFNLKKNKRDDEYYKGFDKIRLGSIFSVGSHASSSIFNSIRYKQVSTDKEGHCFNPESSLYSVVDFNLKDEMRYYILWTLSRYLCFSQKKFREFFHSDFKDNFQEAVDALESLGKIKFNNDLVFLPSDPLERYACALFFFEKEKVRKKINDFFSQSRLKITVNGKELTIKISAIRKNKKYHLSTKNFGFHLSASKDTCQFTNIEKQAIRNLFPLFKIVELENNPESAEEMMNFSRKSINKILLSQRKNFLKNSLDLRVSIERLSAKNENSFF